MNYCPNCGKPVTGETNFCPECGAPLKIANYQNQPASNRTNEDRWLIALILCFYTGNIVTGVLMLITLGGCGVWTIIDLIMIAANTYRDGNGNTLK